jgi:hypothetical protein
MLEPTMFFEHYPIVRNIWLAARKRPLFVLPSRNKSLWAPLKRVLAGLDNSLHERIHVVELEAIFAGLARDKRNDPKLRWHAEQLSDKYVVRPGPA